jgi:hypothetical protein
MRNVRDKFHKNMNAFRWYNCRPRIYGYVIEHVIGNIVDPFNDLSAIARISISDQVEDNIKNK